MDQRERERELVSRLEVRLAEKSATTRPRSFVVEKVPPLSPSNAPQTTSITPVSISINQNGPFLNPPLKLPPYSLPSELFPRSSLLLSPFFQETRKLLFNAKNMLEQLQDELTTSRRSEDELRAVNEEQQYSIRALEGQAAELDAAVGSLQRQARRLYAKKRRTISGYHASHRQAPQT